MVVNFDGKVVGIVVELDKQKGYLPCYPTNYIFAQDMNLPDTKFINDPTIWSSYSDTLKFFNLVLSKSNQILIKPMLKIIEDGLVIGFLTETNQFIQLSNPAEIVDDNIKSIENSNYIIADQAILKEKDKKKDLYLKKINLEHNFLLFV